MSFQDIFIELIMVSTFEAILFFQLAYVISQWIFIRRTEYLWYAAYIMGMAIYALIIYEYIPPIQINAELRIIPRIHLDKAVPFLCYFFYYRFARAFLDMKSELPNLNRYIKYLEIFLLSYCAIELIWKFLGQNPADGEFVFHICSTILFVFSIILIIIFLRSRIKLAYFLVFGAIIIALGSFGTMLLMMREQAGYPVSIPPFLLNNFAVVIELLAFTTGLAYKARLQEIEKVKIQKSLITELQNNITLNNEIQNIRKNIALEIHKEIGENISDISIYSALASKNQSKNPEEVKEYLLKIRQTSLEVLNNMQDFIWTLFPENGKFSNLIKKFDQIQHELLRPNKVDFQMSLEEESTKHDINLPLDFNRLNIGLFRKICSQAVIKSADYIVIKASNEFLSYKIPVELKDSELINEFLIKFDNRYQISKNLQNEFIEFTVSIPKFSY